VRLPELAAPSAAQLEQVASQFEQHGFSVKIGG
jgi:hypothetical protein